MDTVYAGRWLQVGLESGQIVEKTLAADQVSKWLLGDGLAALWLWEGLDPGRDPLDPASPLLVLNGVLTGSFGPGAARTSWCGRSPATGIWGQANMGGRWGAELRFAGFDGLVITGRAPSPVYLWIHPDGVEIRDASHLWGQDAFETQDRLWEQIDSRAQIACIGPAGENLVGLAGIMAGGQEHSRTAGRSGMGALMGSKNLKAIAVRGHQRPGYADRARLLALVREANTLIQGRGKGLSLLGTSGGIPNVERHGDLPLKNWQEGSWPDGAQAISGQVIREKYWQRDTFCHACPLGCGKVVSVEEGPYAGIWGEGPEYETLGGFGGNLLIDDLPALIAINDRCNRMGLDTISTAGAIAFATEAMERGLILPDDAHGICLQWGAPDPVLALIEQIAYRRGLGALLAGGVRPAAERLGPAGEAIAQHVKGLELPYHDPRAFAGLGLNYATGSRGACHLEGPSHWRGFGWEWPGWLEGPHDRFASDAEAVRVTIAFQDYMAVFNPLGLCKFMAMSGLGPALAADMVSAATGWDWSAADLMEAGERLFNLKRLINLRLGVTGSDDRLPHRILTETRPSGGAAGGLPDLEAMLPIYYEMRGWSVEGRPTEEQLVKLGLG